MVQIHSYYNQIQIYIPYAIELNVLNNVIEKKIGTLFGFIQIA